jgi:hypothetical protein
MTRSVHDNYVLGYTVDCKAGTILIRTDDQYKGVLTNVRFEGVIGYLLLDNLAGILFDIAEVTIDQLLERYAEDLGYWGNYWPGMWFDPEEKDPKEYLAEVGASAWDISSPIGFYGFVIGKSMTIEAADE